MENGTKWEVEGGKGGYNLTPFFFLRKIGPDYADYLKKVLENMDV